MYHESDVFLAYFSTLHRPALFWLNCRFSGITVLVHLANLLKTKSWCGTVLFVSKNSKRFHLNLWTRQWPEVSDFVARFCTLREKKCETNHIPRATAHCELASSAQGKKKNQREEISSNNPRKPVAARHVFTRRNRKSKKLLQMPALSSPRCSMSVIHKEAAAPFRTVETFLELWVCAWQPCNCCFWLLQTSIILHMHWKNKIYKWNNLSLKYDNNYNYWIQNNCIIYHISLLIRTEFRIMNSEYWLSLIFHWWLHVINSY